MEQAINNPRAFLKSLEGKSGIADEVIAYFKGYNKYTKNLSKADKKTLNGVYNEYLNALKEEKSEKNTDGEKYSLMPYTADEKEKYSNSSRVFIADNKTAVSNYIKDAIDKKTVGTKMLVGKIDRALADRIKTSLGQDIDLYGFNVELRSDAIIHILKRHGQNESLRGQFDVTPTDIANSINVVADYDNVVLGDTENSLIFTKTLKNKETVVTRFAFGNKSLSVKTMYINKKNSLVPTANDNTLTITSETIENTAITNSNAQNSENVNTSDEKSSKNLENNTNVAENSSTTKYSLNEESGKSVDNNAAGGYNGNGYYYSGDKISAREQSEKRKIVEAMPEGYAKKQLKKSPLFNDLSLNDLKTVENIYNGKLYSYDELSKLDIVKKAIEYNDSAKAVLKDHTEPTKEQLSYFNEINDEFLKGTKNCSKDKKAFIIVGLPSSGKSSAVAAELILKYKAFEFDNDTIKSLMKEFEGGKGANACQEASSYISDNLALPRVISEGVNLVIPIVGKSTNSIDNKYSPLVDAGYDVELYNVELPKEKALNRAFTRFVETGRFVDTRYIQSINVDSINNAFDTAKNWEGITYYERLNNDVAFGQKAISTEVSGTKQLERRIQTERIRNNQSGEGRDGRTASSGAVDRGSDNKRADVRNDGDAKLKDKNNGKSGNALFSLRVNEGVYDEEAFADSRPGDVEKKDPRSQKIYSKSEAKAIVDDALKGELERYYGLEFDGKKGELTTKLWEAYNKTPEKNKLGAAMDIAEYIVDKAVLDETDYDVQSYEAQRLKEFKSYKNVFNLNGIKKEIKYRYDTAYPAIMRQWRKTDKKTTDGFNAVGWC